MGPDTFRYLVDRNRKTGQIPERDFVGELRKAELSPYYYSRPLFIGYGPVISYRHLSSLYMLHGLYDIGRYMSIRLFKFMVKHARPSVGGYRGTDHRKADQRLVKIVMNAIYR